MTQPPYILLVEDNPGDARLTRALLEESAVGAEPVLRWVQTVEAAVEVLENESGCDAVLLDLGLPDGQGLATLHAIRPHAVQCPIVVLTGDDDEQLGLAAVVEGAQDFLVKGSFDARLLRRCLGFAAHRKRAERALLQRALHDELTGLPKRALLLDRLQESLKRSQRGHHQGALLFIDLDHFKSINDTQGHAAGDIVLCTVAERLTRCIRDSDTAARLGGDEFAVLLPHVLAADSALAVGHKIMAALAQPLELNGQMVAISASIGVSYFDDARLSALQVVERADQAMYAAKAAGRAEVRLL